MPRHGRPPNEVNGTSFFFGLGLPFLNRWKSAFQPIFKWSIFVKPIASVQNQNVGCDFLQELLERFQPKGSPMCQSRLVLADGKDKIVLFKSLVPDLLHAADKAELMGQGIEVFQGQRIAHHGNGFISGQRAKVFLIPWDKGTVLVVSGKWFPLARVPVRRLLQVFEITTLLSPLEVGWNAGRLVQVHRLPSARFDVFHAAKWQRRLSVRLQ